MSLKEFSFPSFNERDEIQAWRYTPLGEPRGVVQLIHGFGEHSRRYAHMIAAFQEAGYVVYADDHLAHGKTAQVGNTWGNPGDKGFTSYIEDEETLYNIARDDYPNLPYYVFGHSWGSMIARALAEEVGDAIDGLMLCGLVQQMESCEKMIASNDTTLEDLIESGKGEESDLAVLGMLFDGMVDRFESPATPNDWIACNPEIVQDHALDPLNSKVANNQLIFDFLELYKHITRPEWYENMPKELPIYVMAGDQDPCGNYGEGPYNLCNKLYKAGNESVTVHVYQGLRHEVHNELESRELVEERCIEFMEFCG